MDFCSGGSLQDIYNGINVKCGNRTETVYIVYFTCFAIKRYLKT